MRARGALKRLFGEGDWAWLTAELGARAAVELPRDAYLMHELTREELQLALTSWLRPFACP